MVCLRGESPTHQRASMKNKKLFCYAICHADGCRDTKEVYEQMSGLESFNTASEAQDAGYAEMLADSSYQSDWDNWIVYIFDNEGKRVESSGDEY